MKRCLRICRKAISSTSTTPARTPRPTRASSTASRCPKYAYSKLSSPLVQHEVEAHTFSTGVRFALRFAPLRAVVARKPRVAFVVALDLGHHQAARNGERLSEEA